jgi:hypothetical protein
MLSVSVRAAPPAIVEPLILHSKARIQMTAVVRTWMCAPPPAGWCGSGIAGPNFGWEFRRNRCNVAACRGHLSDDFVGQFGEVAASVARFISKRRSVLGIFPS